MFEPNIRFVFVFFAIILGCRAISDDDEIVQQWTQYQEKFGKSYIDPVEENMRLSIFKENLRKIELHNIQFHKGEETYRKGLTPFTDWSTEEINQFSKEFKMPQNITGDLFEVNKDLPVPDSVDWREFGAVREVKNQGDILCCWAFSCTGALEGAAYIYRGINASLSEENLVDCALGTDIPTGGYEYVAKYGITTEEQYPFDADRFVPKKCRQTNFIFKISSYKIIPQSEEALKQAVGSVGPISVGIQASENLYSYVSGILYDKACSGEEINHAVLVVGYGTEGGQDYWLIKNQWGETWGENGFFKLARNKNNNCNIANFATYPIV